MQVGSVMGVSISAELLLAMYPIPATLDDVILDLKELERAQFLLAGDSPLSFTFCQARQWIASASISVECR